MKHRLKALILPPPGDMPTAQRERLRRTRELFFAGTFLVIALILTWVLFYLFDTGSAMFITVFSLNFILLVGVALVVIRNALKLVLERRSGVIGSRLRTRLTLAFVSLTLAPCLLMFLITTKFVQLSVDFWFKDQVATSMETALEVGRADYERTGLRLKRQARQTLAEIQQRGLVWGGHSMDTLLAAKRDELALTLTGLTSPDHGQRIWHATPDAEAAWKDARESLNWEALSKLGFQAVLQTGSSYDHVVAVLAVDGGKNGYLVFAENMGQGYKAKLDRIASGSSEYKQLWKMKRAMKLMLYVGLGVLTLLIIMGAIWFGIRVAKEISAPMLALARAAQRIAQGDLSVRLDDYAGDEVGALVRSFNHMAADLEASRERLTGANQLLADQNREIAQHSQYIETLLNTITSGVISVDQEGRISMVNKAACSILDNSPRRLLGQPLLGLLPADLTRAAEDMLKQFQRRPRSHWQRQIHLRIARQERRLMVNAVGLATPEGQSRGFVAIFEDISEMERNQRMEAWREVARRIAHEIKNPLTPIKLSAQRLQRKFSGQVHDPAFSQSTSLIVQHVEALQTMVQEFSAFAKLPEINPTPNDIVPLLQELVDFFRNSHSRINWQLDVPEPLPTLPMDKPALHRAFMNLFSNAADVLEGVEHGQVRINAVAEYDRNLIRVDIMDNGPGLTAEELSRMFEPYFSRKKGGTGLGLTIVKSIISDHNGYIRAGLSPEGGATLTVELPIS